MSTPTRYRRLSPAERREQILDAANTLFAERGYEDVLVEDIARAAGVTRGLVHHYFGGRKDVYLALLERLGGLREEGLRPPVGRSARARVADTVSRWLDWTEVNRTVYLGTIAPSIGAYLGLVPSEHSSGSSRCQGPITKTGNNHVRRLLVEAAWHHRKPYRPTLVLRRRWDAATPAARVRGHAGNQRLHARWVGYAERKKRPVAANVAVARELAGWCWSLAMLPD